MACCSQIQATGDTADGLEVEIRFGQRAGGLNVLPQQSDAALHPPRGRYQLVGTVGQRAP